MASCRRHEPRLDKSSKGVTIMVILKVSIKGSIGDSITIFKGYYKGSIQGLYRPRAHTCAHATNSYPSIHPSKP